MNKASSNKLYSAALDGLNRINVFDVIKGVRAYSINLGSVTVVNGPIITQDKMTIIVKDRNNKSSGRVYSLKSGILSYSFFVK